MGYGFVEGLTFEVNPNSGTRHVIVGDDREMGVAVAVEAVAAAHRAGVEVHVYSEVAELPAGLTGVTDFRAQIAQGSGRSLAVTVGSDARQRAARPREYSRPKLVVLLNAAALFRDAAAGWHKAVLACVEGSVSLLVVVEDLSVEQFGGNAQLRDAFALTGEVIEVDLRPVGAAAR